MQDSTKMKGQKNLSCGAHSPNTTQKAAHWEVKSSGDWTNTAGISADLCAKKK